MFPSQGLYRSSIIDHKLKSDSPNDCQWYFNNDHYAIKKSLIWN